MTETQIDAASALAQLDGTVTVLVRDLRTATTFLGQRLEAEGEATRQLIAESEARMMRHLDEAVLALAQVLLKRPAGRVQLSRASTATSTAR